MLRGIYVLLRIYLWLPCSRKTPKPCTVSPTTTKLFFILFLLTPFIEEGKGTRFSESRWLVGFCSGNKFWGQEKKTIQPGTMLCLAHTKWCSKVSAPPKTKYKAEPNWTQAKKTLPGNHVIQAMKGTYGPGLLAPKTSLHSLIRSHGAGITSMSFPLPKLASYPLLEILAHYMPTPSNVTYQSKPHEISLPELLFFPRTLSNEWLFMSLSSG